MPKHHDKKPHQAGVGIALTENVEELLNALISDKDGREWAIEQVTTEGPLHKQVFSALLLQRMYKLVQVLQNISGAKLTAQPGTELVAAKADYTLMIPITLPASAVKENSAEEISEILSHAPEHELAAFIPLLQAIEWSIKVFNEIASAGKNVN